MSHKPYNHDEEYSYKACGLDDDFPDKVDGFCKYAEKLKNKSEETLSVSRSQLAECLEGYFTHRELAFLYAEMKVDNAKENGISALAALELLKSIFIVDEDKPIDRNIH